MAKIRNLALKDIPKINKLMSFMDVQIKSFFDGIVLPYPITMIYNLLPMRFKFMPESYVITDKGSILAFISVRKSDNNHRKWKVSKLFMAENSYEAGLLLLQYIITKFGAKGANTFIAGIDETQNELINLFIKGAGFRQCSRHQIWQNDNTVELLTPNTLFDEFQLRPFQTSDAKSVANLFNETLLTHFRPTLNKNKKEFYENLLTGFCGPSCFNYILENKQSKQIICYFSLKTTNNKNFLMDIIVNKGYEHLYNSIINYGINMAKKRTLTPNFYVLNRCYLQTAAHCESVLKEHGFKVINSRAILIKDLFRTINNENTEKQALFYTDINSTPVFKSELF